MDKSVQLASTKWQQVQNTVRWLVANLPVSSSVELMLFNTEVQVLAGRKGAPWLPVTDAAAVGAMLARFRDIIPAKGNQPGKGVYSSGEPAAAAG